MSYNGSGVFNINTTGQPVVTGTVISSSTFNALTADLATGLSTAITKDGQTTVTANIPFNSYKITGLAAGTAATDAARLGQVQAGTAALVTVTGTDTYTGTMSPVLTAYAAGNVFTFVVPNTNTSSCTINIDSLGAKAITRNGSTALVAGDLVANSVVSMVYDGTRFQVLNSSSVTNFNVSGNMVVAGSITASGGVANGVAYLNGSKVVTSGSALTFDGAGSLVYNTANGGTFSFKNTANTSGFDIGLLGGSGDATGYIYNRSASGIVFAANNAEQMRLNSTGLGIGTSSPAAKLDVVNGSIRINEDGIGTKILTLRSNYAGLGPAINVTTTDPLLFLTANTERMRIDSSGNVGIGTTNAAPANGKGMSINGGNITRIDLRTTASGDASGDGTSLYLNGNDFTIENRESGFVAISTASTERLRIDSSGNVGIGTTTPSASAILDAQSTTKGVRMPNMTTTQKNAISSPAAGLMVFDTTLAKLCVYTGAAWQTITSV